MPGCEPLHNVELACDGDVDWVSDNEANVIYACRLVESRVNLPLRYSLTTLTSTAAVFSKGDCEGGNRLPPKDLFPYP